MFHCHSRPHYLPSPPITSTSSTLRAQTRHQIQSDSGTPILVALDDDPTGTQTCHDIPVLTTWTVDVLADEFAATAPGSGFFILTNSRALHPPAAASLTREICTNLKPAAARAGKPFEVVLRGDSTLRGHFPLEPQAVEDVLGQSDAWIPAPFFLQGGRYTIDDVHCVAEADTLVPAGETQFAKDATFGYASSNLREWVVGKSKGSTPASRVRSLSLRDIREGGKQGIEQVFCTAEKGTIFIVNSAAEEDMDTIVHGILSASSTHNKKFLFRSGAAFVSARLGISPIAPISSTQLHFDASRGGLIIAGSYVPKTTSQLAVLRERAGSRLTTIELNVNNIIASTDSAESELARALANAESQLRKPQDVLVMTSRELIVGADERSSLDIGAMVAAALVTFLQRLQTRP